MVSKITLEEIQKHLNPTHDRVIIEREPDPKQTKAGLLLPDTVGMEVEMTNLRPGRVVAVGPGRWDPHGEKLCPMTLEVGNRVLFHKSAGERIFVFGRVFQIMGDGDCGLVIQDDTPIELVYAQMVSKG